MSNLISMRAFLLVCGLVFALGVAGFARQGQTAQVVAVSAADFQPRIAPDAIVATFGAGLATGARVADSQPLPTELLGTTVMIRDAQGRDLPAPLLFVSPTQINHLIPAGAAPGPAQITVRAGNGAVSSGMFQIAAVAPAIFTANQDGRGVPAATVLRQNIGGGQSSESPATVLDGRFIPRPIDLGPEGERVFLILFLSGLRHAPNTDGNNENGSAENVSVVVGGVPQTPLFAGAQGSFAGLDQVNVEIPRQLLDATLPGSKQIGISVKAAGFADSNEVEISLAPPGAPPLEVTGFNAPVQLLANSGIQILGSGLSPAAANNRVSFGEGSGDVRPGEVRTATDSQVSVIVPFGAVSGRIALNSSGRRWTSDEELQVRTSFSAQIKDTEGQPISSVLGARVCSPTCTGNNPSTNIQTGGWFVLPDPPTGARRLFTIEPPATASVLPFNRITVAAPILAGRDNHLPQEIHLQTIYGPSATIGGGGSLTGSSASSASGASSAWGAAAMASTSAAASAAGPALNLAIEGFRFTLPAGAGATFPNGATTGVVTLTPVKNSLTPIPMPANIFSSSVVQISPFGTRLEPGGKLFFPDRDGLSNGPPPTLFKYDLDSASFIDTGIRVTLGVEGAFETPDGAIMETSIYFIAVRRESTTIVGQVLDGDGRTPIRGAVVSARGQQATTDGNGGYILSSVPVGDNAEASTVQTRSGANKGAQQASRARAVDEVTITSSYLRPSGKTDTVSLTVGAIDIGGVTRAPSLVLPPAEGNRPPVIYAPGYLTLYADETLEAAVAIDDPDPNQTIASATVVGAGFASLAGVGAGAYTLRIAPTPGDFGTHLLTITATDGAGASSTLAVTVVVLPLPTAGALAVTTNEDTAAPIILSGGGGSGGAGNAIFYSIVDGPTRGRISGVPPNITYTPNPDYNGMDGFRFEVSDGTKTSAPALVTITINPVNDPPQLLIACAGPTVVAPGKAISCEVSATDVDDGQSHNFSAEGLPSGATFNAESGQFNWTPGPGQSGTFVVTFTVGDNGTPPLGDQKLLDISVFNAVPVITGLNPPMAEVSLNTLLLTVTGENFVMGSQVRWQGIPQTTEFLSSTQLVAFIQPSDLTTTGSAQVTVFNPQPGGGVSGAVTYQIVNPVPTLSFFQTITPFFNFLFGETGMILVGTGFLPDSVARWDGVVRPSSYISPTQLGFSPPMVPVAEGLDTHSITVVNPGPGGGVSNPITGFVIPDNPPSILFTEPVEANAGGAEFSLVITGSYFIPGAVVNWNGSPRPTGPVSLALGGIGTEVTATIPASDIAAGGTAMITITNPAPYTGVSPAFEFPINFPAPTLTTISSAPMVPPYQYLFTEQTIGLLGTNIVPESVVRWDGVERPTTFINSTEVSFTTPVIPTSEALNSHEITVFNPSPGGGLSNQLTISALPNTAPSISSTNPQFATSGGPAFSLVVNGSFFTPGSVLNWMGSPQTTTVTGPGQLTAEIPASNIDLGQMMAGIVELTVSNPAPFSTVSNVFFFYIEPQPMISGLGPDSIGLQIPSEPIEIYVTGSNFRSDTMILFNGSLRPTTFLDGGNLSFVRPNFTDSEGGVYQVAAVNPAPSVPSPSLPFTVNNPGTLINMLTPMSATAGDPAFTLVVSGQGFIPSSVVRWNGSPRPTTYISKNGLEAAISAADIAMGGGASVTVFNPAPGGGESAPEGFFIGAPFTLVNGDPAVSSLPNGEVLLTGGRDENNDAPTASVEILDPMTETRVTASPMLSARAGHTATTLATGDVLVIGGQGDSDQSLTARSAEIYDTSTGVWRYVSNPGFAHLAHTATLLADGRVLVAGGLDENGAISNRAEIYDPVTDKWAPTGNLHFARAVQSMARLADGRVLIAGGRGEGVATTSEIYNPATGVWESAGRLSTGRSEHSAVLLADGRVLIAGGRAADGRLLRECEIYNPLTGAWSEAPQLSEARAGHTMIILNNGRTLMVGGRSEKK